jgi:L-ascorbate 6-phosphate lactonase
MEQTTSIGEQLLRDVQARWIPEGGLGLWWLGQSSFIVRGAGRTVYIDPYLNPSPRRIVPPPLRPDQVTSADLILCTHDHSDHIDPTALPGIAAASPHATIVAPAVAREKLIGWGIPAPRVVAPRVDEPLTVDGLSVTAIPAAHEELDYSPEHGYPYLGYLLALNGVTLYHAGDCTMYDGLVERLRAHRPDVALLPINGHDWKRTHENIIGNMGYREAADLAVAAGADLAIPMHYGMFRHNTEPPGHFVDYVLEHYPTQKIKVMARYEGFVYLKGRTA